MRIFKGLENIHAVIDSHDNEWRKEQGEPEITPFVPVRERVEKIERKGKGGRDPNRFLGEGSQKKNSEPNLEIVEPIKQEGTQHSWLYNEIRKAVEDAVGNSGRKTKVVAIIVPVIQNGKEFENMSVDEKITLPPVPEEIPEEDSSMPFEITVEEIAAPAVVMEVQNEAAVEESGEISEEIKEEVKEEPEAETTEEHHDFNLIPDHEHDEELVEAFNTMGEKLGMASETEPVEPLSEDISEDETLSGIESEPEIEGTFPETEIHAEESELLAEEPVQEFDEDFSDLQEQEAGEPQDAGEAMSFDEFPVLKEEANVESSGSSVDEFIEEVTPADESRADISELPSIEDFDDDEVFEETLETLETGELENEEAENENNNGTDDEVIRLD